MIFAGGMSGNHQILKTKTLAEMLKPQNSNVPLDFNFQIGLGWMLSTLGVSTIENAGTVAHHSGGTVLFHSQMYILPEHKLGVIVLSNSGTARGVVDHVATETLTLALEAKSDIRQPTHSKVKPTNSPLDAETINTYIGYYTTLLGFVQISACGKSLCANIANHNFDLIRGNDGLYRLEYSLLGIFHIDLGNLGEIGLSRRTTKGRELIVGRIGSQEMLIGQRIQPLADLETWRRHLGDYEITNLADDYKFINHIHLSEERGFFLFEITPTKGEKMRAPLMPISGNEGIILGPLSDGGDSIRIVMINGEERILFSGYQLKKIVH